MIGIEKFCEIDAIHTVADVSSSAWMSCAMNGKLSVLNWPEHVHWAAVWFGSERFVIRDAVTSH